MFVVLLVLVTTVGIKGEERAAIVQEIVYELSQNASNLFMKDIGKFFICSYNIIYIYILLLLYIVF